MVAPQTVPIESLFNQAGRIPHAEIMRRSVSVLSMPIPSAARLANRYRGKLIIAGGGPSLAETLPDIRRQLRVSKATKIAGVNKTHDWLLSKGLKPDFGILIDPKPWVANYMTPTRGVRYFLGAKVDPATWERFRGHPEVYHWHPLELEGEKAAIAHGTDWMAIPGQSTVGLRSIPFGYALGFRKFELHGLDCNKRGYDNHAYQKFTTEDRLKFNPEADLGHQIFYVKSELYGTRFYEGTSHMARQCGEFKNMLREFDELTARGHEPCEIRVAGVSAMGYVAALKQLHVNDNYNKDPSSMPMTGAIDPQDIELVEDRSIPEGMSFQTSALIGLTTPEVAA